MRLRERFDDSFEPLGGIAPPRHKSCVGQVIQLWLQAMERTPAVNKFTMILLAQGQRQDEDETAQKAFPGLTENRLLKLFLLLLA